LTTLFVVLSSGSVSLGSIDGSRLNILDVEVENRGKELNVCISPGHRQPLSLPDNGLVPVKVVSSFE
jgi:hypothetical protein